MAALPYWRRAAKVIYWVFQRTWHTTLSVLTLLDIILLPISAYSDLISPTVWIVAPFLGLVFGIILLLTLFWLTFLLVTRHWVLAIAVSLMMLICSGRIWRYCPMHFGPQEALTNVVEQNGEVKLAPIDTLRVLTYNTCGMGKAKVREENIKIPVMEMARTSGADIICLQEYVFSTKKGMTEQAIRNLLKKEYPYYHMLLNAGRNNCGIALFSKWPILMTEKIDKKEKDYCWAFYCELNVHGRTMGVVNCHLSHNAISEKNRKIFHDQIKSFRADSLTQMEEGLRQLGPSFRLRTEQVATIRRYLAERAKKHKKPIPLLICGDMNDTPTSFAYRIMRGDLDDTWEDAGLGLGITFREMPFYFRIDHLFHSKHLRALDVKVMRDIKYSDHYPVMATYQLLSADE